MAERDEELLRQLEELVGKLPLEDRLDLVAHLSRTSAPPATLDPEEEARLLSEAGEALDVHHDFVRGQFVEWKPNLRNRDLPGYGQPAVVLEILEKPLIDEREPPDSPFYREPLDLVLGLLDGDDDLAAIHFDSRRFRPVVDSSAV
jgi:hypothetical protein